MKFVCDVATKAETKVKMQKAEKRERHDRGGLTFQRCVNVTEVESMSEAERKKRGNVRMTEECYRVRGGCMLQALRGTSRSAALGDACRVRWGRMEASAAPRSPVPGVCVRA